MERLVHLHRARGTTLVLVTHSAALARRADRVLRLSAGRIEDGDERASVPTPSTRTVAASAPSAATAPAPLGAGLRRFVLGFAAWTAIVVAGILALNLAVAAAQQRGAARQQSARDELRRAALQQLRADVESVAPDGADGYRVTLSMDNLDPQRALFVLGPAVRVFIQAGGGWKEVPSRLADGAAATVTDVAGRHLFTITFTPDVTTFEEQLAGYYHVRIGNVMLVSRSREARDDVFERADAYYVYVKPRGADDAELRRRNGWSGTPPVWIPMPAH